MLKIGEYKALLAAVNEGNQALADLQTYKALIEKDSVLILKLQKEIDRKEGVIVSQIEKNKTCYTERTNLQEQLREKDAIITTQGGTIARLSKPPKRFSFGIGGGYGYAFGNGKAGPVAMVGISYSLFKF
ncbi:MAG TPA: hypothetical protein VFT06_00295 [Flavisolibacter sp.]|nr:hypothetical protein [Flavisolibacter sp.]